ncbi:hypothetical protein OAS39_01960 [Pirellulales bacterium]|nr:hypothetical protein [Pirellulales bacterium]
MNHSAFLSSRLVACGTSALLAALAFWAPAGAKAADDKFWSLSAYDVHIAVVVDDAARPDAELGESLVRYLVDRIDATVNPLWQADVALVAPRDLRAQSGGLEEIEFEELPERLRRFDKLQTLVIKATTTGYELQCREYDAYVRRWGGLHRRTVRQPSFLSPQCFQLLLDVFAPTAAVTPRKDDPQTVELTFRGIDLPRRTDETLFVAPGQIFQPVLRRTNRAGELVGGGVPPVSWTFLTTMESSDNDWLARIESGVRRPFGGRRRGTVRTLAVGLRPTADPTRVRFYARHSPDRGLAGYEVYRRAPDDDESTLLGVTDASGTITLPTDLPGVMTLFLRSDGQLLAKAPVAPGTAPLVEVPIADDPARLRAAAELTAIREQLIDLVAQRAILMSRARAALEGGDVKKAQEFVNELGRLPSRSVFDQKISSAERGIGAKDLEDAQVRAKIDKMFADTRNLLGRFLDSRPISQLQTKVTQAAKEGG